MCRVWARFSRQNVGPTFDSLSYFWGQRRHRPTLPHISAKLGRRVSSGRARFVIGPSHSQSPEWAEFGSSSTGCGPNLADGSPKDRICQCGWIPTSAGHCADTRETVSCSVGGQLLAAAILAVWARAPCFSAAPSAPRPRGVRVRGRALGTSSPLCRRRAHRCSSEAVPATAMSCREGQPRGKGSKARRWGWCH